MNIPVWGRDFHPSPTRVFSSIPRSLTPLRALPRGSHRASVDDAVQTIASIAQAGHDVRLIVETLVDSGDDDVDVGAITNRGLERRDTLGGSQDAHAGNILRAALDR